MKRICANQYGKANRQRRRGIALLYTGLAIPVLLGIAAYVVDTGYLYRRKADAQKAADAAALAGAIELAQGSPRGTADKVAKDYAGFNGFSNLKITSPWAGQPGWYHVVVNTPAPMTFARVLGFGSSSVAASATALYTLAVLIPIDPQYYGINTGPVNYTMFGPYGLHSNGDDISVKYLDDGSANSLYNGKGYDFSLLIPADYASRNGGNAQVQVELYDPDCYNSNGQLDASATAVDEIRSGQSGGTSEFTSTQYSLWYDLDGNAQNPDPNDHIQIATKTYGNVAETDMKWVTPPGFTFDPTQYGIGNGTAGNFRINATTVDGSSENGFNMRAGPPHDSTDLGSGWGASSNMAEADWHDQLSGAPGTTGAGKNGTQIAAVGNLPMNFNVDGTADILLGFVPASAQGGQLVINKFDTDVGAQSVYYTCDGLPGQQFPGTLAGNDLSTSDTISLPTNYPGGTWHAIYSAGSNDTSVWSLAYTRGTGTPSNVRLVQ